MSRLTTAQETAGEAAQVNVLILCELDLTTGFVRAHSATGSLTWDSKTWLGVGTFGGVDRIAEGSDGAARGLTVSLTAFDVDLLGDLALRSQRGRDARIWYALCDPETWALIGDPVGPWEYLIDQPRVSYSSQQAAISLSLEPVSIYWARSTKAEASPADQKTRRAGDTFFDFADQLRDVTLTWGGRLGDVGRYGNPGPGSTRPLDFPLNFNVR